MSVALWSFVAPHGTLELPAIFIAGGAGLVVARSLVVAARSAARANAWSTPAGCRCGCSAASCRC